MAVVERSDSTDPGSLGLAGAVTPFRERPYVVYDSDHDQLILFGGQQLDARLNDMWTCSLGSGLEQGALAE